MKNLKIRIGGGGDILPHILPTIYITNVMDIPLDISYQVGMKDLKDYDDAGDDGKDTAYRSPTDVFTLQPNQTFSGKLQADLWPFDDANLSDLDTIKFWFRVDALNNDILPFNWEPPILDKYHELDENGYYRFKEWSKKVIASKNADVGPKDDPSGSSEVKTNPWSHKDIKEANWNRKEDGSTIWVNKVKVNGSEREVYAREEQLLVKKNIWVGPVTQLQKSGKAASDMNGTADSFAKDIADRKDVARLLRYFLQCSFAPTAMPISPGIAPVEMENAVKVLPVDASDRIFLDPRHRNLYVQSMFQCEGLKKVVAKSLTSGGANILLFKNEYFLNRNEVSTVTKDWVHEDKLELEFKKKGMKVPDELPKDRSTLIGIVQGPGNSVKYFCDEIFMKIWAKQADAGSSEGHIGKVAEKESYSFLQEVDKSKLVGNTFEFPTLAFQVDTKDVKLSYCVFDFASSVTLKGEASNVTDSEDVEKTAGGKLGGAYDTDKGKTEAANAIEIGLKEKLTETVEAGLKTKIGKSGGLEFEVAKKFEEVFLNKYLTVSVEPALIFEMDWASMNPKFGKLSAKITGNLAEYTVICTSPTIAFKGSLSISWEIRVGPNMIKLIGKKATVALTRASGMLGGALATIGGGIIGTYYLLVFYNEIIEGAHEKGKITPINDAFRMGYVTSIAGFIMENSNWKNAGSSLHTKNYNEKLQSQRYAVNAAIDTVLNGKIDSSKYNKKAANDLGFSDVNDLLYGFTTCTECGKKNPKDGTDQFCNFCHGELEEYPKGIVDFVASADGNTASNEYIAELPDANRILKFIFEEQTKHQRISRIEFSGSTAGKGKVRIADNLVVKAYTLGIPDGTDIFIAVWQEGSISTIWVDKFKDGHIEIVSGQVATFHIDLSLFKEAVEDKPEIYFVFRIGNNETKFEDDVLQVVS